jgi:hypothetical protein
MTLAVSGCRYQVFVLSQQGDCAFPVDQTGDIGCVDAAQGVDFAIIRHGFPEHKKKTGLGVYSKAR